ncbi:MAG: hypothetical protein QM483_00545 [Desulfuromusa sp.]
MKSHNLNMWSLCLLLMLLWLLAGCSSGKYFEAPQSGEIPKGPGLFTKGDTGAVLFDSQGGGLINPEKAEAPTATAAAAVPSPENTTQVQDFKEFESYKQWQEWKKGAAGSADYKDFQDWQQWERYQKWKQQQ